VEKIGQKTAFIIRFCDMEKVDLQTLKMDHFQVNPGIKNQLKKQKENNDGR
jgi:hypothetical protein